MNTSINTCPYCYKNFSRIDNLRTHIDRIHSNIPIYYECTICKERFDIPELLHAHRLEVHHNTDETFTLYKSAWQKFKIFRHICPPNRITVAQCFTRTIKNSLKTIILHELMNNSVIKFSLIFTGEFMLINYAEDITEVESFPIRTAMRTLSALYKSEIMDNINASIHEISSRIDDLVTQGSGWVMNDGVLIDIEITHVKPLAGGGLHKYVNKKSPYEIYNQSSVHSIENMDAQCFFYAAAAAFIGESQNYTKNYLPYKQFSDANFITKDFIVPFRINDISKFEQKNKHLDISFNVLYAGIANSKTGIFPAYISKLRTANRINIVLTLNSNSENHYHFIPDMNKFLRKSYIGMFKDKKNKYKKTSYAKQFFCLSCLHRFSSQRILEQHEIDCYLFKDQSIKLSNKTIEFTMFEKVGKLHVVGFFDFECLSRKFECLICKNDECLCPKKTRTLVVQEAICYSLLLVNSYTEEVLYNKTYTGYDAAKHLITSLIAAQDAVTNYITKNIPLIMTIDDELRFREATKCYLCNELFTLGGEYLEVDINKINSTHFSSTSLKARDHNHATGKFIGAAHISCNLQRKVQVVVPLYCHNFTGYDSHLLITALKYVDIANVKIKIIPKNLEKITNMQIGLFSYNDSLSFLKAPLAELVNDLKSEGHDFKYIKKLDCLNVSDPSFYEKLNLITSKGIFPYDFVKSIEQMKACKEIPDKKYFYNSLNEENISDENYSHAQKVFNIFGHANMCEYMEFYCRLDVFLLCEVFNKFRNNALKDFDLDPAMFLSLPSLAYNAMLKLTKVKIDACTDIDMYNMIKKGIRGGHSYIAERAVKVRNHEDEDGDEGAEDFLPKSENTDFAYVDCNNLYGTSMTYKMPIGDYKWMTQREIDTLNVEEINTEGDDFGFIAEVDLEVIYITMIIKVFIYFVSL
jgi:hypothetical protein